MRRFFWPTLFVVLLLGVVAATRLRLPAVHLEVVRVEWKPRTAESERGRAVDRIFSRNISTLAQDKELHGLLDGGQRVVTLPNLWVDRCEVSQAEFQSFIKWRAEAEPGKPIRSRWEPWGWKYKTTSRGHRIAGRLSSPASGVAYYDAYAYCKAVGGRLPYADEWLGIAGGREGRVYPWGNEFRGDAWPYQEAELNANQVCGRHPLTDTPSGVHDLAGGVMEWSSGDANASPDAWEPALHGAPADRPKGRAIYAMNGVYRTASPVSRGHQIGFRCVYNRLPEKYPPWGGRYRLSRHFGGEHRIGITADARLPHLVKLLSEKRLREVAGNLAGGGGKKSLQKFSVARCEVSRGHYKVFLSDPLVRLGLFANRDEPKGVDYTPENWAEQAKEEDLPVVGVNWWAADAFARWAGGSLPTVEQWNITASGDEGSRYPWGDKYDYLAAVTGDIPHVSVASCGSRRGDSSATGVFDMGGNVSEWTRSLTVRESGYAMRVKGGSFMLPGQETAAVDFSRAVPLHHRSADIGIRIVFD